MRKFVWAALAGLLALPLSASALEVQETPRAEGSSNIFGVPIDSLSAGFGYGNWTGEAAPDIAPGYAWDVRLDLDVTRPVDLEVAYQGGINSITASGLSEFNIYNNQAQLAAQVQPVEIGSVLPYVSGGIGLARASVAKNPDLNVQFQSDTMGVIPLAAGADYDVTDKFKVGAQANWDVLFDNEILTTEDSTGSSRWGFTVNVGATNF